MSRQVFIIGATGYVGGILARHVVARGDAVTGLARTGAAAARLAASGIRPAPGDLETGLPAVLEAALAADAVIYAAQVAFEKEPPVLGALCDALAGTGKSLLFLSGSGVMLRRTQGAWSAESFAEDDPFDPEPLALPRVKAERLVIESARRGVRAMVIRPPVIWGPGDDGPVAQVYRSVARTGAACYVAPGLAVYANVHGADVAELFSAALERGRAGALYHATAGEIPYRWIAEAVARDLGVATRGLTMAEAVEVFGPFGALLQSACSRLRDARTRAELDWRPRHHDMLSLVGEPRLRALAHSSLASEI